MPEETKNLHLNVFPSHLQQMCLQPLHYQKVSFQQAARLEHLLLFKISRKKR